jgi:hypothetical protein
METKTQCDGRFIKMSIRWQFDQRPPAAGGEVASARYHLASVVNTGFGGQIPWLQSPPPAIAA